MPYLQPQLVTIGACQLVCQRKKSPVADASYIAVSPGGSRRELALADMVCFLLHEVGDWRRF